MEAGKVTVDCGTEISIACNSSSAGNDPKNYYAHTSNFTTFEGAHLTFKDEISICVTIVHNCPQWGERP
jgi:hypothetical protein